MKQLPDMIEYHYRELENKRPEFLEALYPLLIKEVFDNTGQLWNKMINFLKE